MGEHGSRQSRIKRRERSQHVGPALWICHHRSPLVRRESRVFVEDVSECLVNLADVVKESDTLDASANSLVESGCVAENQREARNPPNVRAGYGVIGVDRIQQSLQRRRSEALGMDTRTPLTD